MFSAAKPDHQNHFDEESITFGKKQKLSDDLKRQSLSINKFTSPLRINH